MQKGKYSSSYYSDSANTIEIAGRYVGDIRLTHTWKDWLVYLETTNFLDKHYEKYRGMVMNGYSGWVCSGIFEWLYLNRDRQDKQDKGIR